VVDQHAVLRRAQSAELDFATHAGSDARRFARQLKRAQIQLLRQQGIVSAEQQDADVLIRSRYKDGGEIRRHDPFAALFAGFGVE
jgi:hypothetical protein